MLIAWMAYAALLASLVYLGAVAAERVAAIWIGGRRFIWIASILIAAVTPVVLATRPSPAPAPTARGDVAATTSSENAGAAAVFLTRPAPLAPMALSARARVARVLPAIDPYLRGAWLVASCVCLALFGRAAIAVRRQRSRWRSVNLDGARVFVSPDVGPAVIGALRPDVIIPEWALSLDDSARSLMLRHETEHIRARDPLLLFIGSVIVAAFPWNPALWLLVRRLRLAIEIDCDRRVLRASTQQREYGMLLLTVGARNSTSLPFATSLAERRPFLEWRIRAMTTARPRNPRLVSTACVALALVATTAAARAPRPQSLGAQVAPAAAPRVATPLAPQRATPAPAVVVTPAIAPALAPAPASARRMAPAIEPAVAPAPAAAVASAASVQSVVPARVSGEPIPIEVIRALLAKYHPNVLRGDASVNLVAFVLDANGNYVLSTTAFQATDTAVDQDMQATRARLEEVRASTGRGRGGRGSAPSASMDSAAAALRAAAESLTVVAAAARGGVIRSTGSTTTTTTRYVGDTVFVKRTTTTFGPGSALADLVDEKTIESVEIRKLPAGVLGPLPVGVIIVQLKR